MSTASNGPREDRKKAEAFVEAHKEYLQDTLYPAMDPLVKEILEERPSDPVPFMAKCLFQHIMSRDKEIIGMKVFILEDLLYEIQKHLENIRGNLISSICHTGDAQDSGSQEKCGVDIGDFSDSSNDSTEDDDDDDEDEEEGDLPGEMTFEPPPSSFRRAPRKSVSAEAYGEFNVRRQFVPPVYEKDGDQRTRIANRLDGIFLFDALEPEHLDTVISAMKKVELLDKTRIIQQGDDGDALYIIDEGSMRCLKVFPSVSEEEKCVKVCGPGDLFGELALLYNCPRAASVESDGPAIVWKLDRETFSHIVKEAAMEKRERYDNFLRKVPLLKELDAYDRMKIGDALKPEKFLDDESIVTQGDPGNCFYMIEEGNAAALKIFDSDPRPSEVMKYGPGDYFGELAILRNTPRAATVVARGNVKTVHLTRKAFKRLLGPLEERLEDNATQYAVRRPLTMKSMASGKLTSMPSGTLSSLASRTLESMASNV